MGRRPAVVQWQGRTEWNFLLCRESMADRGVATEASRRDLYMGGRCRFLSGHGASRRHLLQRLHARLVDVTGLHRAKWPGIKRLQEPHDRWLGFWTGDALGRGTRRQSPGFLRRLPG